MIAQKNSSNRRSKTFLASYANILIFRTLPPVKTFGLATPSTPTMATSPLLSSTPFPSPMPKFDDKSFFEQRSDAGVGLIGNDIFESLLPKVPVADFKPNLMLASPPPVATLLSPSKLPSDSSLSRKLSEDSFLIKPKLPSKLLIRPSQIIDSLLSYNISCIKF